MDVNSNCAPTKLLIAHAPIADLPMSFGNAGLGKFEGHNAAEEGIGALTVSQWS
jgi:hypothetical protein